MPGRHRADPDEQRVGERTGGPDRRGLAVPREVEPEQLAQRDQGGKGDREADRHHPGHYRLYEGGHHQDADGHGEQAQAGAVRAAGMGRASVPVLITFHEGLARQRVPMTRSGTVGSS